MKLLLAAGAAGCLAAPAPAETRPAQTTVRVADLRLDQVRDQQRLDRRIGRAADALCGRASDAHLAGARAAARCRAGAVARAQPKRAALVAAAFAGQLASAAR